MIGYGLMEGEVLTLRLSDIRISLYYKTKTTDLGTVGVEFA